VKLADLSNKPIKVILWLALIGFIVEVGGYIYGLQLSDIFYRYVLFQKDKANLESTYHIRFKTSLPADNYPQDWDVDKAFEDQTVMQSLNSVYDQSRLVRALKKEIRKYPHQLLSSYLEEVYFFEKITFQAASAAGLYSLETKSIYLSNKTNTLSLRIPKFLIQKTFHHELSSIFMGSYNFNHDLWRVAHGKNFQYEIDKDPTYYWMHMRGHTDPIDKEKLLERGMLRQYAETGVENDFNIYASEIFTNPRKMKKLIKEYPIIQRKYEVFKAFYLSIDVGFSPVFDKIDG